MVNIFLRDLIEAHRLREESTEQAVRILIGSSFPGMVGKSEVHFHGELLFRFLMHRKFGSVVIRARLAELFRTVFAKLRGTHAVHGLRRSILHLPSYEVAGLSLRKGSNRLLPTLAHDGVTLPVTQCLSLLNHPWARIDHALVEDDDLPVFLLPPALPPQ